MRSSTTRLVDATTLERLRRPRSDLVGERPGREPDTFELAEGPFRTYRRSLAVSPAGPATYEVVERFDFTLAAPLWGRFLSFPVRRGLRNPHPRGKMPWWAPPDRVDAQTSVILSLLCTLSVVSGYLGTVITQTITFATDEFGTTKAAQGNTLAAVRVGVVLSMAIVTLADRHGRRRFVVVGTAVACLFTGLGALAPSMWTLGATQTVARGITTAVAILILVIAAEELPASSRAYGISVLVLTAALGSGMAVWALPLADLGERGWRLIYVIPLVAVPFLPLISSRLPETRRFELARSSRAGDRGGPSLPGRRLLLLGAASFFLLLFRAPASQLQNEFLRDERGFSASGIALFTVVTSTPAGIGVFIGGKIADRRGRRGIGAIGLLGGATCIVAAFLSHGWPLWAWTLAGVVLGSLTVPSLGVYGPELFTTRSRGRANGIITVIGVLGSAAGLVIAGYLSDRWGLGRSLAVLSVGPVLVAVLVLTAFPETAHRELEEINPDDADRVRRPG